MVTQTREGEVKKRETGKSRDSLPYHDFSYKCLIHLQDEGGSCLDSPEEKYKFLHHLPDQCDPVF